MCPFCWWLMKLLLFWMLLSLARPVSTNRR
jgi:hypothetical protein